MASTLQIPGQIGASAYTELDWLVQLRPFPHETSPDFEAAWRDLEKRSLLRNPFLSPSFLLPQWQGAVPQSVELLTIKDQQGRWLFAGLFERSRGTRCFLLPHLKAIRTLHTFKTGVLVDAADCEEIIDTLWSFLRMSGFHGISFPIFPGNSSLACLLTERCERDQMQAVISGRFERATTSLGEMFEPSMSSKRAKSLRRGRRSLEKLGPLEFRIRDEAGADDFIELEQLGWKGDGGSAIACDERQVHAFRQTVSGFGRYERVRFAELVLGQRLIASMCLFRSESDYYAFKIGWDPELERGCPGFLLAAELQTRLTDLPHCERIDGCANAGSFLDHVWGGRKLMGSALFTTTRWGSLAAQGSQLVRGLLRRVRGTAESETQPPPPDRHSKEDTLQEIET